MTRHEHHHRKQIDISMTKARKAKQAGAHPKAIRLHVREARQHNRELLWITRDQRRKDYQP